MRLTSLRARLGIALAVLVVLGILQVRAFVVLGNEAKDLGTIVRLVTLERGRSQAIAKDVLLLERAEDAAARAELRDLRDRFERTLEALLSGGTAYYATVPVEVAPVGPTIAGPLREVELAWSAIRADVEAVLAAPGGDPALAEPVSRVARGISPFLDPLQRAAAAAEDELAQAVDRLALAGLLGTLVIGAAVGAAWLWVGRSLVRPLERLSAASRRIASGDLNVELAPTTRRDEVGLLTNAFAEMTASIRRSLEGLAEAARSLASSSAEILAAVNQLTSGATEESAAVMEIGSTAQEVRLTAEQAAERARAVAEAATRTSEVAGEGQAALAAARAGLVEVAEKVDAIAGRILALSERMQAIGEIVDVVNDLADQSNLLAVNAAIEAAKAGEHGRGFAVVAQEVRNLADQSREATGQVSAILTEIQRSANDAVLATEQGTRGVRSAVDRLEEAGTVIDRLAAEIVEASELARQIAASAAQQRAGVDQIALGIENVGQVSNQTVAAARQLQQEAEGMTRLAEHLRSLVERFQLGASAERSSAVVGGRQG